MDEGGSRQRHEGRGRADVGLLAAVALAVLVILTITTTTGGVGGVLALVLGLAAPVAVLVGVRRHSPPHPRVWRALGLGLALLFASDLFAWLTGSALAHVLAVAGYVCIAVGGLSLLRHRDPGKDLDAVLDATIFSICGGVLVWHFVISPELRASAVDLGPATATLLYPLADVALLVLILRLVLAPGCRVRSFWYLCGALVLAMACNLVTAAGDPALAEAAGAVVLFARALAGAAALHPSMRALTTPGPASPRTLHRGRLLALAACLAVVPTLLGVQGLWGSAENRALLMVASLGLTVLVLLRLASVMGDRDAAHRQLAHLALHDPLTGLPNRRLLLDRVEMALARAARNDSTVTMLFCDLDRFKTVNDSLGHDAGDLLLQGVAERLKTAVRPQDTVARLGGDEFVMVCEGLEHHADQLAVAERVRRALTESFEVAGQEVFLSTSVGLASDKAGEGDAETLLARADTAMYAAKAAGRDRVERSDPDLWQRTAERLGRENALRRAVESGELRLEYQPILDLRSGSTASVEALVRWQHPQRGLLAPAEFIGLAEETGIIVPLGAWVLREACRQLEEWRDAGRNPGAGVSVNVSSRQLADPSFASSVRTVLASTGVDPGLLCLEITEDVLVGDSPREIATLETLAGLGVHIAVDDFGTGYASLSYLKRLPVDTVKIDRAFVAGLGADPHDDAIVAAIVTLGHTLGLQVVGEGVETAEQLHALEALGCDAAQGFFLGVPAPPPASTRPSRVRGRAARHAVVRS